MNPPVLLAPSDDTWVPTLYIALVAAAIGWTLASLWYQIALERERCRARMHLLDVNRLGILHRTDQRRITALERRIDETKTGADDSRDEDPADWWKRNQ